jgi:hypothetical protein
LTEQLPRLRPVTQSQYFSGIVSSLGATNAERAESGGRTSQAERSLAEAPVLLLIHVYQDTMAALFKADADFAGSKNREAQLRTKLQSAKTRLSVSRREKRNTIGDLTLAVALPRVK